MYLVSAFNKEVLLYLSNLGQLLHFTFTMRQTGSPVSIKNILFGYGMAHWLLVFFYNPFKISYYILSLLEIQIFYFYYLEPFIICFIKVSLLTDFCLKTTVLSVPLFLEYIYVCVCEYLAFRYTDIPHIEFKYRYNKLLLNDSVLIHPAFWFFELHFPKWML